MSPYLYRIRKRGMRVEKAVRALIDALEGEGLEGVVENDGTRLILFARSTPRHAPSFLTPPVEVAVVRHEDLVRYVEDVARGLGATRFRISVRGCRGHMAEEAKLGEAALRANPDLTVDLGSPSVVIEVDYGDRHAYVRVVRAPS